MSAADIGVYGEELYQQVLPLHGPDPDGLAHDLVGAWTHGVREIDELVRDTPEGPGWGVILDVDRAPIKGLPWLAQLAGVSLRPPKLLLPNMVANANRELGSSAGWASSHDWTNFGFGATSTITAGGGSLSPPGGFHVHVTSIAPPTPGAWSVLRPVGRPALIEALPNAIYGFSLQIYITDVIPDAPGQLFWLQSWFLDENFAVLETTNLVSGTKGTDIYDPGDTETLVGYRQSPPGTAYAGAGLVIPSGVGTASPLNSQVDVGEVIVLQIDSPEITFIPSWPLTPDPALESDEQWAVYARDAIRRQGGRNRGTPDAILSAAEDTLTGSRYARLLERVGGNAYRFTLITRPSETPDPALTLAMASAQVPGGSKLTHTLTEGAIIDEGTRTIDTATGTIDAATLSDIT